VIELPGRIGKRVVDAIRINDIRIEAGGLSWCACIIGSVLIVWGTVVE
jgi:hypothetical protein